MISSAIAVLALLFVTCPSITEGIDVPDLRYLIAYEGDDFTGPFHEFLDSSPDLSLEGLDNVIGSVCGTGEWMFYDLANYEIFYEGLRGFNVCLNVSQYEISSVRCAGSPYGLNDVYYNLYEGTTFQGAEFGGNTKADNVGKLEGNVSSLIISGQSPWTFYTGVNYSGAGVCVYPDLRYTDEDSGMMMDIYWMPYLTFLGLPDNSIRSVAKGCLSPNVVKAPAFKNALRDEDREKKIFKTSPHKITQRVDDKNAKFSSYTSLKSSREIGDNVGIGNEKSLNPSRRVHHKKVMSSGLGSQIPMHRADEKKASFMREEILKRTHHIDGRSNPKASRQVVEKSGDVGSSAGPHDALPKHK